LSFIREESDVRESIISGDVINQVIAISELIAQAMFAGKKIAFCGNGGSATFASHMAGEFVGRYKAEDVELPAFSFVDTGTMTAIANDYGYNQVFNKQIKAHLQEGDILVVFTTSGNSPNLVEAVNCADELGVVTIALTGKSGGEVIEWVQHCICVPSDETPVVQSIHVTIGHIICEFVDEIFGGEME